MTQDDPVELLEGWLIYKMPKNPPHRAATKLTRTALEAVIPDGWYVDAQEPITLEDSEPEPDVVVVRGNTRDYLTRHPSGEDLALVVEIADSTLDLSNKDSQRQAGCPPHKSFWRGLLERDRTIKKRLYARAGIPIYWIINQGKQCIEVYSEPVNLAEVPTYQQEQIVRLSDAIALIIAGKEIGQLPVADLLP